MLHDVFRRTISLREGAVVFLQPEALSRRRWVYGAQHEEGNETPREKERKTCICTSQQHAMPHAEPFGCSLNERGFMFAHTTGDFMP